MLTTLIEAEDVKLFSNLVRNLKAFEQRKCLNSTIAFVVEQFSSDTTNDFGGPIVSPKVIAGAAGLISQIIKANEALKDHLVASLGRSSMPVLNDSLAARRSITAALKSDEGTLA